MPNVKTPLSALLAPTAEGQQLMQLGLLGTLLGVHDRTSDAQFAYMNGISNFNLFTIDTCKLVVSQGGDVEQYPVFAEMTPTAYAEDVPAYMPNRTYMEGADENGEGGTETTHTWETYPVASRQEIEGKHYIACSSTADYWPASIWTQVDGLTGVNVISTEDYKALQPVEVI